MEMSGELHTPAALLPGSLYCKCVETPLCLVTRRKQLFLCTTKGPELNTAIPSGYQLSALWLLTRHINNKELNWIIIIEL
jgi:hypothetical protein